MIEQDLICEYYLRNEIRQIVNEELQRLDESSVLDLPARTKKLIDYLKEVKWSELKAFFFAIKDGNPAAILKTFITTDRVPTCVKNAIDTKTKKIVARTTCTIGSATIKGNFTQEQVNLLKNILNTTWGIIKDILSVCGIGVKMLIDVAVAVVISLVCDIIKALWKKIAIDLNYLKQMAKNAFKAALESFHISFDIIKDICNAIGEYLEDSKINAKYKEKNGTDKIPVTQNGVVVDYITPAEADRRARQAQEHSEYERNTISEFVNVCNTPDWLAFMGRIDSIKPLEGGRTLNIDALGNWRKYIYEYNPRRGTYIYASTITFLMMNLRKKSDAHYTVYDLLEPANYNLKNTTKNLELKERYIACVYRNKSKCTKKEYDTTKKFCNAVMKLKLDGKRNGRDIVDMLASFPWKDVLAENGTVVSTWFKNSCKVASMTLRELTKKYNEIKESESKSNYTGDASYQNAHIRGGYYR